MAAPTHDEVVAFIAARDPQTVHGTLGIRFIKLDADETIVELDVSERLYQHAGIVHGGIYALLMESAASTAAALSVDVATQRVAGQELSCSHVRAAVRGVLRAVARPIHRGRTVQVFLCEVFNEGRLVSTGRVTMAVRPMAGG